MPAAREGPRHGAGDLGARILFAIPAILFAILIVAQGGLVFAAGLFLLGVIALGELYTLMARVRPINIAGFLTLGGMLAAALYGEPRHVLMAMVIGFLVTFYFSFLRPRRENVSWAIAATLFGAFWVGLAMVHAVFLRETPHGDGLVVDVLVGTFLGDTAAYFGGRLYGRRPLAPQISPNKTLEGLIAGIIGGTFAFWCAGLYQDWLSGPDALIIGAAVALTAPLGDLFESLIKRDLEVKDTGKLFGPHGGVLDRLDAVFFSMVAAYYEAVALGYGGGPGTSAAAPRGAPPRLKRVRRIIIVGSTGSIGIQALDVIERSADLELVGLSAASSWEPLLEQARRHGVRRLALADPDAAAKAGEHWPGGILAGPEGLIELITDTDCDLVLNALVGSAGLGPTVAALGEGIDLALANKESLVVGGELVMALAEATSAQVIPVDSEHSALHQLVADQRPGSVERMVLTASGGPFRGRTDLEGVSRTDALAHPTWEMGGKITIDSATLMNKGLELIEAHHLFGVPYERIDVVVHPQSIVHAMVHLNDGASLAHLGYPDMRVPISYALNYPERHDVPVPPLDLVELGALTFEAPDTDTFACLRLAREAAAAGGTAPCVLNAANEVAVHAFLDDALPFTGIARVIERALEELPARPVRHFSDLVRADSEARELARRLLEGVRA